ncbi:leucine zipper putative tumor suppressor 2a [Megalops cyprinoides]|uniref:leucine zipper putative tumor suppressor 2a n=1 Tax=Megalops cyprinoides TaxID=118141 RepID=UPI0018640CBD|nr:leucine zipper putative tumor suppressor 2a [Megalops cyprinoides]XP_036402875.1 leucine zipper putative tumor suppressor 2a [Megalops cyprinoides]XP_036402876.1 leucine zipper putative tumor suppressor 2a [Megalops cyprinoides]XP_036402877.1 leucine zipper putative tumor suppressor 2a [Megalops cyprinoides]
MALVQTLPAPSDHPKPSVSAPRSPPGGTMGSVSSLIAARTYQERHCRKPTPAAGCVRQQEALLHVSGSQELLVGGGSLSTKRQASITATGNGNYSYLCEDSFGDWNDNHVTPSSPCSDSEETKDNRVLNGNIGGPPPKLIPVSGKLEKNIEKTLIRPTAFKPVVPKNRNAVQYLSPRPGCSLSESQGSLNLLLPGAGGSLVCTDKRNSYSGGRNTRGSQSCTMSDSGRNSLSSLPTYSSAGYSLAPSEAPGGHLEPARSAPGHGHSNSDSGRSSSSKSTGSLSGRGQPLSDSGSCGRSPAPAEGYEAVVRELEEKLRERELELQQLRENLDENEAAICQVYEEKQKRCELELEELRQSCSSRMKQASQKAVRAQQVLQLQVFQLQQEKKKLQEDFSQLLQERELLEKKCASIEREQTQLGPRLEETKWEVCQKSGEISLLKQQLKDLQVDLGQKAGDIVALKAQLREARAELQASQARAQEAHAAARTRTLELEVCENELQRRKSEAELLREKVGRLEEESARLREALSAPIGQGGTVLAPAPKGQGLGLSPPQGRVSLLGPAYREEEQHLLAYESDEAKAQRQSADALQGLRQQVERLRAELLYERRRSEDQAETFEEERRVWQEEKEKVIHYQKQLQQNYIQMYRRNRELERVMRELSLELETRDLEEIEGPGNEIHFEEITATEI